MDVRLNHNSNKT